MTKTELNCLKVKTLQGHNSKEKAELLIYDDIHTQPSAESIVHYQHKQNPNVLFKDEKARMKPLNV